MSDAVILALISGTPTALLALGTFIVSICGLRKTKHLERAVARGRRRRRATDYVTPAPAIVIGRKKAS